MLKQAYSDTDTINKVMNIMNSFVHDVVDCLESEVSKLFKINKTKTLSSHPCDQGFRVVLAGIASG